MSTRKCLIGGVLVLAIALPTSAWTQTVTDERVWTGLTTQGRMGAGSPWRWAADAQVRTRDGARTLDFLMGQVTIGRSLTRASAIGVGYSYGSGFLDRGDIVREHRLFQQYAWSRGVSPIVSLKTRVEERFIEGDSGMLVRVRQQVRFSWPLAGTPRLHLVASEECFFYANSTAWASRGFDHNRIFTGVRQRTSARSSVEIGYLNVYARLHSGATRRSHVLAATWGITLQGQRAEGKGQRSGTN